ncbi:unnamed protein product [Adineta steineri]|uniref:Huntingtin-like protein n=1 Tax=Adineta steineri TaxID=433720 RepID=A0A818N076_9BILA|nr:unnamed protein product [Adineta steineri]
MDKLSKSLEVLKILSSTTSDAIAASNEKSRLDPMSISKEKIHHLNIITDLLSSQSLIKSNTDNYFKFLTASVETLFLNCDDNDHDVRLATDENLNKLIKNLKDIHLTRIQVELHRIIKRNPNVGPRALKGALWRFAELANVIHAKKIRPFFDHLFGAFCSIAARSEDIVHEKLPEYYELIFRVLGRSINDKEIKDLLLAYLANMSHESSLIRRSSAACLIVICHHSRYPMAIARYLITYATDQLLEHHNQTESIRLINGYLGLIKNLIQLLGDNLEEFLSSPRNHQQPLNTSKNIDANEQHAPINIRQIIESVDIVCYLCLQHNDHNVVSSSLETLEVILKYSNLFDFDQLLISTENKSIEQTRVSQTLQTAYPTYQRSFIEINELQQNLANKMNDELDSTSIKRTSAAKLVEQLISKYILNIDGTVKTNDESRVSIKCNTVTCLSYLSTIDPFAFFDSFDYPAEIITYLLSLREHDDPHLRGACANLLAKLIQTTVHLLTISPPISSLSSSFHSSFINQCSLVSTDSQESSRLDIQLGILAELLSTFRSCLNDDSARVIHVSLNALRTLLPVLLTNSHALTIIAIELLEDAIQHSSNTYILAKVALAQLIGEIDFRILTYLEQQQQVKKTNRSWLDRCMDIIFIFLADEDARVRQVAATTFAKFVDHSSFLPCQWPIHSLLKWINSSCQWIYTTHRSLQPTNPSIIVSNTESQCETISCLSTLIFDRLAQSSTRIQIVGCLEGISALVNVLTPTTVRSFFHNQYDELRLLIHFFKHPFILHDLNNLQILFDILNALFINLSNYTNEVIDIQSIEKVFHFLIKILSIFACIVEDTSPPAPAISKINFPQIPASPQQLKKRFESNTDSNKDKDIINNDGTNSLTTNKDSSIISSTLSIDKDKKLTRTQLGAFGNNPSMMKLFELIRASYQTHKGVISSSDTDRFGQLLSTTLICMRSVLNLVSIQDISKHLDETLNYLKSTFNIDKINTILCTQEFLQNIHQLATTSSSAEIKPVINPISQTTTNNSLTNIHTITIRHPMMYLFGSRHTSSINSDQSIENTNIREFYLTAKQRKTIEHIKRPPNRNERTKIGNYIRSFETIVILSLKKYVISNETEFQAAVLNLLVQLLLLRVNYSLLDADEVSSYYLPHFLTHITTQLELIEDTISGFDVSAHFIYRIAEFLVILSHDTLHSKQVIKVQDLIKHGDLLLASGHDPETHALSALEPVVYDLFLVRLKTDNKELEAQRMVIVQTLVKLVRYNKALKLLTVILDSVRSEVDKWKRLSRQIVDALLGQIQLNVFVASYKGQSLLDIYSTQLTLFDVVSSVALRPIDPFVAAFHSLANRNDFDRHTISRWLMNINIILRCLIQNSTEDAILTRWKDIISSANGGTRDETFSAALLRILHDIVLRLLTNTRQSRGQIDMTLVALTSDYLYLIIYIIENAKQFRTIVNDFSQLLIHDESDETVHRLDSFSYLNMLSEYFKLLSSFYIPLILQWTHILNILDHTQEPWWSSMLSIPTPSSLITHLSISGQLQSYCDLICRHELYVEHLTSIITHRHLLFLLFEQSDTCTYVHNLFGLIHRTPAASHLFVESIYTNWDHLLKRNKILLSLKILRTLEGIHLDESGLLLVLLIEQFLTLPYISVLRLTELIVCRRIEMMLTLDEQILHNQLMPRNLPLILQALTLSQTNNKHDMKSNEHLWALIQRLIGKIDYKPTISFDIVKPEFKNLNSNDEDHTLNWIRNIHCPMDITPKIYAQMLKNVVYKKLLPFMMSPDFVWLSMPHCLLLGVKIPSLWRASTSALIKKINDLCFSLPAQRLISNEINFNDDESTPDSIYIKSLLSCSANQPYLIALIDSMYIYFETIQNHTDLTCQFSAGDIRDLLRFLIFISEIIYINILQKKPFLSWNLIESFFRCLTKTIHNPNTIIYQLLCVTDQIISCCTLAKTILSIFEYLYKRYGLILPIKQTKQLLQSFTNLIEPDNRPYTQYLLLAFNDLDCLYKLTKEIKYIPHFYRYYLRTIAILLFRLPIFNSFIRIPTQFWKERTNKLQFGQNDYCLSLFSVDLLQHSDIMADYIERISFVGWLSRTQFQEIWVTFLAAINPRNQNNDDNESVPNTLTKEEILETNATQCVWVRGVTTFLLNALRLNCTGNPADMILEHRSRNKPIQFLLTDIGDQYIRTRSTLETSSNDLFTNIERLGTHDLLTYGQLSYDTILASIQSNNASPLPANSLFDRLFSHHGLDLTSSLQILIEIYVRWLTNNSNDLCLQLKYELIRSFIYLSDLFTSSQQLTNLYDICAKYHSTWFEEDDLMISLISYGLCKSGILLGQTGKDSNEFYKNLIERNFKFLTKTNAYASCLFLLESHEDDLNKILIPILNQELTNDIQTNTLKLNLDIRLNSLILANLFYLIENNQINSFDTLSLLFKDELLDINDNLTQEIVSIGLERLLLLGQYPKNDIWRLYKRSITTLRQSTWLNLNHLVLILARIYTLLQSTNENSNAQNNENTHDEQEMIDGSSITSSSDNIVIELVGELYERTKQSSTLPYEAILLLRPLPSLLAHIGLSDRLMNKMVVEFAASTQQLYPQILAYTVFAVFRALINAHYLAKVNEWTLLSMTSVAQRKPIRMAIWGLTCLMLSACPSHAIADSLFPLALSRYSARFEELDNRLFLLAGREYYQQLNNIEQRRQFEQAFINESNTEKLYADLLAHLRDTISPLS